MADLADMPQDFKKKRPRSAPYPTINLKKATERASKLYEKAQQHTVPVPVLASAWGYTSKSGALTSTISALRQFGLLRAEGSKDKRRYTLTDDAIRLTRDSDPKSPKRMESLKRAALAPTVHAELWEKYDTVGLSEPMEDTLRTYLILDRKELGEAPYTESATSELIQEYRETMTFANFTNSDIIPELAENGDDSDNLDDGDEVNDTAAKDEFGAEGTPDRRRDRQRVTMMEEERELTTGLLSKDAGFRLIVSGKIGAKEIERLIAKLELDKEILAEADDEEDKVTQISTTPENYKF